MNYNSKDLREMANAVRAWALHAVQMAHSGHIGIVLGAADIMTVLYSCFLRRNYDRFVMSAGHGSALLYSVLKMAGYDVGDLATFRRIGGLPGHPEYGVAGVDATTGPLGQGVGNAVGMAMAEKIKKTDGRVYCLCSDGDLMEGVAQEAIAFAGRYKLDNLILIWDDNGVTIDGAAQTDVDVPARMRAAGWRVLFANGDNFVHINRVLNSALLSDGPVFIQCKTQIGAHSSLAGKSAAHGLALKDAEMMRLIQQFISPVGEELWRNVEMEQMQYVQKTAEFKIPNVSMPVIGGAVSTRELSGIYLQELLSAGINIIAGSADLGGSTNVKVAAAREISSNDFSGNYINYGVREHAMGAIMNGLTLAGLRVCGSTFLVFSDYMRPSMRLAALSGLPVIYLLTHDSIAVGEDGPTHQPVEQLPGLRMVPNLNVFRPCNATEVLWAWQRALREEHKPSCIVLSRQRFVQIPTPFGGEIRRGAYVIRPAVGGRVRVTLLATGAEVPLAVRVAEKLGRNVQVVSVPSVSDFRAQPMEYKSKILSGFVVAIEAAATAPWFEFADAVIGVDKFGTSGPGDEVYAQAGFNVDAIVRDIKNQLK